MKRWRTSSSDTIKKCAANVNSQYWLNPLDRWIHLPRTIHSRRANHYGQHLSVWTASFDDQVQSRSMTPESEPWSTSKNKHHLPSHSSADLQWHPCDQNHWNIACHVQWDIQHLHRYRRYQWLASKERRVRARSVSRRWYSPSQTQPVRPWWVMSNGKRPFTATSIFGITGAAYLYLYTLIIAEARFRSPMVTTIRSCPVKLLLSLIRDSGYRLPTFYREEILSKGEQADVDIPERAWQGRMPQSLEQSTRLWCAHRVVQDPDRRCLQDNHPFDTPLTRNVIYLEMPVDLLCKCLSHRILRKWCCFAWTAGWHCECRSSHLSCTGHCQWHHTERSVLETELHIHRSATTKSFQWENIWWIERQRSLHRHTVCIVRPRCPVYLADSLSDGWEDRWSLTSCRYRSLHPVLHPEATLDRGWTNTSWPSCRSSKHWRSSFSLSSKEEHPHSTNTI